MENTEVKVGLRKSYTKNIGNYESSKVEYWIEKIVPLEQLDRATQEISLKIDDFITTELEILDAQIREAQEKEHNECITQVL